MTTSRRPTPPCATGIKLHLAEQRQHNIFCHFALYCEADSIINITVASLQQTTSFFLNFFTQISLVNEKVYFLNLISA